MSDDWTLAEAKKASVIAKKLGLTARVVKRKHYDSYLSISYEEGMREEHLEKMKIFRASIREQEIECNYHITCIKP